jgi:hypothetical protein
VICEVREKIPEVGGDITNPPGKQERESFNPNHISKQTTLWSSNRRPKSREVRH